MKNISLSLLAALSLSTFTFAIPAHAQTPPSVLQPYKAYNAAMQAKDYKTALRKGEAAWKAAERELGESKTTGDLAFNYGFLEKAQGSDKKAVKPLMRAADLSATPTIRVEREVELVAVLDALKDYDNAKKRTAFALDYAEKNGMGSSIFAAELMVFEINECNRRANRAARKNIGGGRLGSRVEVRKNPEKYLSRIQAECGKRAEQALSIFNANAGQSRPDFVAAAANAVGYAKERDKDWLGAALAYQSSRAASEDKLGRAHPLVAHTIGRWLNARTLLKNDGKLETAMQSGFKDDWPFVQDTPKVQSSKRVEPDFATSVINSQRLTGYAILLTDVSDSGQATNMRVLTSHPGDAYVKMSREALEKWQFPPKSAGEAVGFRKDIAIPFSYVVFDRDTQETL